MLAVPWVRSQLQTTSADIETVCGQCMLFIVPLRQVITDRVSITRMITVLIFSWQLEGWQWCPGVAFWPQDGRAAGGPYLELPEVWLGRQANQYR